jgi:hypothetical protein
MGPELGQVAFRIGIFLALVSGALLVFLDRTSAEYVVSVITFVIAVAFLAVIAFLVRRK